MTIETTEVKEWTINQAMKTGKVDETYGTEYVVSVNDFTGTFNKYFKKEPKTGDKMYGAIESGGKYGNKFKKADRPDAKPFVSTKDGKGNQAPRSYGAQQADKNDGQRQGMAINNAANYINSLSLTTGKQLNARDWSKAVHAYASALYSRGELRQLDLSDEAKVLDADQLPQSVQDMFGIHDPLNNSANEQAAK
jgi:hypothetical protein